MQRVSFTSILCALAGLAACSAECFAQRVPLVAPTEALSPAEQQKKFHLPPGFEIQLIASEPEIQKPINMSFDPAGRLFVTCSLEYPFPAERGTPRDTIRVLSDTNGDGVPDKASVFADGLNIPIGVLPLSERIVIGYSIPNIYRFEDTDGDGKADRRDVLYSQFGFDDAHGMASSFTWTLDGWIHGCHGFRNTSAVAGQDSQSVTMNSGNTYRFRADGSHIEQFTHGQVNPFGMAFDPQGNLYTADCHSSPIYMLLRGAFYPSFGKPHDGMGFAPEMIRHNHGSTGICGVVYYDAPDFPAEYRDTVFIGNPVNGRINHDKLEAHGSSYQAIEQPDFVSCDDLWFRPVDIKLAPDGSIYVADFYNCIIGHYEVDLYHPRRDRDKGRIWRIVYTGDKSAPRHAAAPNFVKATTDELVRSLDSANIAQRTTATHQLVQRVGETAVPAVKRLISSGTPRQKAHALYVLSRQGRLEGAEIERLSRDDAALARVHVARVLGGMNWGLLSIDARALLIKLLGDADGTVRRAAADSLGQHPEWANIGPLLKAWETAADDDRELIHMVRLSLRDTLAALDGLEEATREFRSNPVAYPRLADVALGVHTPAGGLFVRNWLQSSEFDGKRLSDFVGHAARNLNADDLPPLYDLLLSLRSGRDDLAQADLLRSLNRSLQARGASAPPAIADWQLALAQRLLKDQGETRVRAGLDLVREAKLASASADVALLAAVDAAQPGLRQPAAEALAAVDGTRALNVLCRLIESSQAPSPLRLRCADLLGNINSDASRAESLRLLRSVPDSIGLSIARSLSRSRDGAADLLMAVAEGRASPRFLQDLIVSAQLRAAGIPNLIDRLHKLLADLPSEDERIGELLARRRRGFRNAESQVAQGQEVFQKICANCHRAAGKGAKVGPDLDGIGARGVDRLLEDVLVPSRNVDQAFRTTTLLLKSGRTAAGLLLREEGEVLVLANETGQELRVSKSEIEEQNVLKISPMPANIAEQLSDDEFYRLLSFLLSLAGGTAGQTPMP